MHIRTHIQEHIRRLCIYVYIYVYIHMFIYEYANTYTRTHPQAMHICIYIYVYIHIYIYEYANTYTRTHLQNIWYRVAKTHKDAFSFICHLPQKSPISGGSFAESDLQLKAFYASSPPSTNCGYRSAKSLEGKGLETHRSLSANERLIIGLFLQKSH